MPNRARYAPTVAVRSLVTTVVTSSIFAPRATSTKIRSMVDDVIADLDLTLKRLDPPDDILLKQADELIWLLAVLVAAPPPGAPANLAGQLHQLGLLDMIHEKI